ncbi:MAG: hypothetical protein AABX14_02055 [Candidatus Aenigmatarchaeota archaeon]
MKWKDHLAAYHEHRAAVDWAVNRGIDKSQRIAGAHISRAAVELLAAYLVREKLMEASAHLNHRWFKSAGVGSKLPDFPDKGKIIKDMNALENKAEVLTYGAAKSKKEISDAMEFFLRVEEKLKGMLGETDE